MNTFHSKQTVSSRHRRLSQFAKLARIFSWVILIFYILLFTIRMIGVIQSVPMYQVQVALTGRTWASILQFTNIFMDTFGILIRGVVFTLVLKGIALGLSMILETRINCAQGAWRTGNE